MTANDDQAARHLQTWHGFMRLATWSAAAIVTALVLMWAFLI